MQISAVLAVAYRDFTKLLRDRARLVSGFVSPILTVIVLGGGGQVSFDAEFSILYFVLVGVMVQSVFSSTTSGTVWLLEDRTNDFSQAIFVSPISRYAIVFGKILGETLVALPQGLVLIVMGLVIGLHMTALQVAGLLATLIAASLLGGALGILVITNLSSQQTANQIVPWVLLPQLLLSEVYFPLDTFPIGLDFVARLMPLRYPVDLARAVVFANDPAEYARVVSRTPAHNVLVMAAMFVVFLVIGTALFVRSERNR